MGSKIVSCDDDMLTTHQTRTSLPFRGRSPVQQVDFFAWRTRESESEYRKTEFL